MQQNYLTGWTTNRYNVVIEEASGKYRLKGGALLTKEEFEKLMKIQGGFWLIMGAETD